MTNMVPTKKFHTTSLLVLVVSAVLYLTSLFIVFGEINKIKNAHKDTESGVYRKERMEAILKAYEENKSHIDTMRNFFVQKGDEVKFIEHIEYLGKKSDIDFEIESIDFRPANADSVKEDVLIKIKIKGPWARINSFVDGLEKSHFGVLVKDLDIDKMEEGVWFGLVNVNLYRQK